MMMLTNARFDLGPQSQPYWVNVVLLCCSGLEDANKGYGDDEEAQAEERRQASFLFPVDANKSEEQM